MNAKYSPYNIYRTMLLSCCILLMVFTSITQADTVALKNSKRIKCEKAWEEDGQIKCMRDGSMIGFSKESVERIEKEDKIRPEIINIEGEKTREPIRKILKNIQEELEYTWDIIRLGVQDDKLIVVLNNKHINKEGYLSMLPWICTRLNEYPNFKIKEIRVLNSIEDQGWIYLQAGKCNFVAKTPLNQVGEYIDNDSKIFDPYEERRDLIAKTAKIILRSKPNFLTVEDAKKILMKYNLCAKCDKNNEYPCNPEGNFPNQIFDNGDGSLTDLVTGLMWQKDGSGYTMEGIDAQSYIDNLNSRKFLGYHDWRLPTIEELVSIIEPEKSSKGLYINPMFSSEQDYCWSSDNLNSNVIWSVYFKDGLLMPTFHKNWQWKVRAVR